MDEEKLKNWIEDKLEKGIEAERIKESLENTGHDPSIVEELKDPFHHSKISDKEGGQEDQKGSNSEDKEQKNKTDDRNISLPDLELPQLDIKNKINTRLNKKFLLAFLVVVFLAGSIYGISQIEKDFSVGKDYTGCNNQGVMIQEISVENGKTVADVKVVRNKSKVVLKILDGGEKIGESYDTFIGENTMTVNAVGSKAVLHPVKCKRYIWRENY